MKNKLLILITLLLAVVLCFAACSNKPDDNGDGTVTNGIKSLEVVEGTIPTQVNMGDDPDFSGIKVKVTFEDGTTKEIGFADVTISKLDTITAGEKVITITYGEASVKVKVMVVDPNAIAYVTNINIVEGSFDKAYHLGQTPDMSALQVEAVYSTGKKDALPASEFTFTPVDTTSVGKKTFTVTYTANPEITVSVEYEVIGITSMNVITNTVAKKINVGETLDTSALELSVEYADGKSEIVPATSLTIGTIDTATYGVKNLEITYQGVTIQYPIEVVGMVSLEVNPGSYDAKVKVFTMYTTPAITAVLTYSDGTEKALTAADLTVGELNVTTVGKQSFTVSYAGLSTSVEVEVVGVESLTILPNTVASEILLGQTFSTSDIKANVTYTDGTTDVISAEGLTLGSIDTSVAGEQALTVSYLNKFIQHTVKVCSITSLRVEGVNRVVAAGQKIDLTGMKVYGVYNDTEETEVLLTSGVTTNVDSLDINSEEDKTLVVSYNGVNANVVISTTAPELVGVEIRGYDKYVILNGTYNKNKVNVYAVYANGTSEKVTGFTMNDIATGVAGTFKLTVSYTEDGVTKTAEADVEVLPVTALHVNGAFNLITKRGEALDISGLKFVVVYSAGEFVEYRVIQASDVTVETPDTSVKGDHTFKVSYLGAETNVKYYVKGVESIAILGGSVDSALRAGYAVDYSDLYLNIVYSNGDREQIKASDLKGVTYSGTDVNSSTFGVTYEGKSASMSLTLIKVTKISALNNTIPALVLQGSVVDFSSMKLSVYYENGDVYLVPFTDSHLKVDLSKFDINTPDTYGISFIYNDGISVNPLTITGNPYDFDTSVNIIVRGIVGVEIVEGSVFNKTYKDKKVDTSGISVKVTYDDGTYIYVNRNNPALTVGTVDTSKVGKTKLEVVFSGVKGSMEITVEEAPTVSGLIFGALKPDEIVARDSYKNNFKNNTSPYFVGDDNPFYFYLNVIQLDENDNVIDVDGKSVPTSATIYMDGSETPLTGDALTAMVAFDSIKNAYDFTEAAIGHTFKLVIRPADATSYVDESSVTKDHTVTIVDGYNIYNAWELNIMTNVSRDITGGCMGDAGAIDQLTVATKFLASKGITRPEKLSAVVLHCNLDVQVEDLPSEYFYRDASGNIVGLFDYVGLFHHNVSIGDPKFEIYGNYFTVYSYNVPCVTPKGVANNDDEYSSSDLFRIRLDDGSDKTLREQALAGNSSPFEQFTVNIKDIASRDNDPNSNDQTASERHMRGIVCYKLGEAVINMNNVNIEAYMNSVIIENVNTVYNVTGCKFYNAWQGHLFLWSQNEHQNDLDAEKQDTWSYTKDLVVNIHDSSLTKCGGPVILVQSPDYGEASNKTCGVVVDVTGDSKIETHVTGQEAWFVAVGQTQLAAQIKAMSGLVGGGQGYISTDKIQGVETITMSFVSMAGDGMSLNGDNCNAVYRVNGVTALTTHSPTNTGNNVFANPMLDAYTQATIALGGRAAPIFQSSAGGTAFTDGKNQALAINFGTYQPEAPSANFYQGDYITLYYGGAGIVLDYIHP